MTDLIDGLGPRSESRIGDWCQWPNGKRFYPFDPRPEDIDIRWIALGLSREPRWCGLTRGGHAYSVAQHAILVSMHCDSIDAPAALLHDGEESVFHDLPSPVKSHPCMAEYREFARAFRWMIFARYGLQPVIPDSVKRADLILLATEARDLHAAIDPEWEERSIRNAPKLPGRIVPWPAEHAERVFLAQFRKLFPNHPIPVD